MAHGGAGGILAAAHVEPEAFVRVFDDLQAGDLPAARRRWDALGDWIPLLFGEPNPAPVKAWLAEQGLIRSPECRLPLTAGSPELADELRERLLRDTRAPEVRAAP